MDILTPHPQLHEILLALKYLHTTSPHTAHGALSTVCDGIFIEILVIFSTVDFRKRSLLVITVNQWYAGSEEAVSGAREPPSEFGNVRNLLWDIGAHRKVTYGLGHVSLSA